MNINSNLLDSISSIAQHLPEISLFKDKMKEQLKAEKSQEKGDALQTLEQMFIELKKVDPDHVQHKEIYSTIIGRYGARTYPIFEEALPYLQASIQMKLQDLGLVEKENFSNFETIQDFKNNPSTFEHLNQWLKETNEKRYPEFLSNLDEDSKLNFAQTLISLGATYNNLSKMMATKLGLNEEEILKFRTRFHNGIKELLCSMEQTPEVQKEIGELFYNIFPGFFLEECKLRDKKEENSIDEVEKSLKILWEAAKYNPAKSMQARLNNLSACLVVDFKEKMNEAKEFSLKSNKLWREILDSADLTKSERESYTKLSLNAKSVYVYILREQGASYDELNKCAEDYLKFYEMNGDRDPYSMIHLMGLCRIRFHNKDKEEVLKWTSVIEDISKKYPNWAETATLLKAAQELKAKAEAL